MQREIIFSLLGKPRLYNGEQALTAELISAKGQALLIYLAVTRQSHSRTALAGLLWGDMPEENARANLRLILTKLRKFIPEHLEVTRQEIRFRSELPYQLDVDRFEELAKQPGCLDDYKSAAGLYRGDFLDDFILANSPDFDHWAANQRERLRQSAIRNLLNLIEALLGENEVEESLLIAQKLLISEPWNEEGHRYLMRLLALSGQRSAALSQYEACRRILFDELGVEPSAETTKLYEHIKDGQLDTGKGNTGSGESFSTVHPGGKKLPASRHNLPIQLSSFVGREAELVRISELLSSPGCRLISLVGPGGVGKTRLALTAAEAQIDRFRDGVRFVSLQGLVPSETTKMVELLISSIADSLDYTFSAPRPPQELLLEYLKNREILLLLDNFELFLSPNREEKSKVTAFLLEILKHAPGIKLMVTSRELLNLIPEWLVEVEGLPYPPTLAREAASNYPAVSLFVQHARRINPEFTLVNQEDAVNRICQLVGGFPLGIELSAHWVRLLSCAEIAARLEQAPDAILDTSLDGNGPHASMRAVLDSSWQMMTGQEQQVFRRLSVFQESFTLAAAQQVASADLSIINGLMNKSLLRRKEDGRYALHELLNQYGAAHLAAWPDETREVGQKHSCFYADFLESHRAALEDEKDRSVLLSMDEEIENIRAGWEWLLKEGEIDVIAGYLEILFLYYQRKGWSQEAIFTLEQALSIEKSSVSQKGRWHRWLGEAFYNLGNLEESRRHLERALALLDRPLPTRFGQQMLQLAGEILSQARNRVLSSRLSLEQQNAKDRLEVAGACNRLCVIYWFQSQFDNLMYITLRGLNLAETVGMSPDLARAYATTCIGVSHIPWPVIASLVPWHALAEFYLHRALEVARNQHQLSALTMVLEDTGLYWLRVNQRDKAQTLLEEGALLASQIGDGRRWEECIGLLGVMLSEQGRYVESLALQKETLASARRRGDKQFQFHELSGMAENAMRLGNLTEAMDYLTEAESLLDGKHGAVEEIRFFGVLAQTRQQLGDQDGAQQAARMANQRISSAKPNAFYCLEGYAGPSEVYLSLWETDAKNLSTMRKKELTHSIWQAGKALQSFGNMMPVGLPRAWLHKGLRDWLAGQPRKAHRSWAKSLALADRLSMPYEAARAHFEIGQHLTADDPVRQEHLSKAADIFSQLGAVRELERVRALVKLESGRSV